MKLKLPAPINLGNKILAKTTKKPNKKQKQKQKQTPIQTISCMIFVAASYQTGLDTRSKAQRPIKMVIERRGRSGTSRDSNPAGHLVYEQTF